MSKKIKLSQDMVGKKVRCINKIDIHHPEPGIIGTIIIYDECDAICTYKVQWPKGSTVGNDRWWAINKCIELVEDNVTNEQEIPGMTNEEIWEMLESKMRKNGLKKKMGALYCDNNLTNGYWVYTLDDVHNAIALAYKVGYLRSQKGRPFKIAEKKKQGGHWEPVGPENLPKEGTKVRCKKEYRECSYDKAIIQVGDLGVVKYLGRFGIKVDCPRTNFVWFGSQNKDITRYFDMWVEDNE